MPKKYKYQKKVIYKAGDFEIAINKIHASRKLLLELLKEQPLTRKQIIEKTNWTRGQLAGLLFRAKNDGLLELRNNKFYLKN